MKDFLAKLPPLLASISKAFLIALIEQMREVARNLQTFLRFLGRLFLRSAKWLWEVYYRVETQLLGVIVDVGLAVVALRYFFLLLGIGIALVYFKQWILAVVYVLLLGIAAFRFFRIDSETIAQENEYHKESHNKFIRLLRLPFRVLSSVVLVYASWRFVGWPPLNIPWLHKSAAAVSKPGEIKKAVEVQPIEVRPVGATITSLKVGESINFPIVKLPNQVKADRINTYLKDQYTRANSNSNKTIEENLLASCDELDYKEILNTPSILSIEISTSAGRAGDRIQHHFDLSTGYIITIDQIVMPSKWDEIRKLVCNDSKKRLVQVKNKLLKDIGNRWYEKNWVDHSFEDGWQDEMKKEYLNIKLEKEFDLSNDGISFYYVSALLSGLKCQAELGQISRRHGMATAGTTQFRKKQLLQMHSGKNMLTNQPL